MGAACNCLKFTINCLESTPIEIDMQNLGIYGGYPLYGGNYNEVTYFIVYNGSNYEMVSSNDNFTDIFSLPSLITNPCNRTDWIVGTQSFCTLPLSPPYAQTNTISNCDNVIFSGDCSCKSLGIPNAKSGSSSTIFYKTCDGNEVQQPILSGQTIVGCFSGTPTSFPSNVIINSFSGSNCNIFCLTGDTCCLRFTAQTETQTTTSTIYPTGMLNGYPFFVYPVSNTVDYILFYDVTKNTWYAISGTSTKPKLILDSTSYCPTGTWEYEEGPILGLITEQIDCPSPSPTPTPTPTTTPTPTPTPKPPLTPKALDFINECAVITLFPMGVECVITNPSPEGSDGSVFLNVTGGTPPYSITWENGNIGPNLYNLTAGTYKSVVTDFYKDFTANTECVLTGSTPVPSPTPTPTPTPPYIEYNLCMQTSIVKGEDTINEDTPFIPNGILNGRPSWISFDSTSIMYWNDENSNWVVSSSTNNDVIVCANPAYPPIFGSWFILGNGTVYVSSGSCEGEVLLSVPNRYSIVIGQPLRLSVSNNDPVCGCDGNITLFANGGIPPYLYTIDSGLTYKTFPIFNDLCSGLYAVKVKDSTGLEVNTTTILSSPTRPITYSISFNTTNTITSVGSLERIVEYTTTISVSPELPDGVTLTFDLTHMNVSQTSPNFSSSTFVNSSYLSINDVVQPITISYETGTTFNVLAGCQNNTTYKSMTTDYWYGIQFNNTTNLVIKTISEIYKIDEVDCYLGLSDETYQISNISINGCDCCNVITT